MSKLDKVEFYNLISKINDLQYIVDRIKSFDEFEYSFSYKSYDIYHNFVDMLENKINEWEEKLE